MASSLVTNLYLNRERLDLFLKKCCVTGYLGFQEKATS